MPHHVPSEVITLLLADIGSYTKLSTKLDRKALHELHDIFDSISIPTFESYSGRVIKKTGDAFMVEFKSATNALHCAIDLQNKFRDYNSKYKPVYPILIRVAVHTGEVIHRKGDVYGDAVNIVSRLESLAPVGSIFFTKSSFLSMNKNEIPFKYLGPRRFKGIRGFVKVFRVKSKEDFSARRRKENINLFWKIFFWVVLLVILYFVLNRFF